MRKTGRVVVAFALVVLSAALLVGCANCPICRMLSGKPAPAGKPADKTAPQTAPQTAPATNGVSQQRCPVLGGAVDTNVYVDYQGKRVYFCCATCKEAFLKDPVKYALKPVENPTPTR